MGYIQITAYLRNEEDYKVWKDLPNKVEFLHLALQSAKDIRARVELKKQAEFYKDGKYKYKVPKL